MTSIRRMLTVSAFAAALAGGLAAPGFADPPPWAPAHGWRAKHGYGHEKRHHGRDYRRGPEVVVVEAPPRYVAVPVQGAGSCHRDLVNREVVGTVLGGAAGAAAGSQIGKGNGQIASVIAGTIIGGLIGGSVGHSMDQADTQCVGQALEYAQTGQPISWNGPRNVAYTVTPMRTYQVPDGRYCREYQESAIIGGRPQQVYGTACRQPDGAWQIQN